jgi:hypothetical protein
LDVQEFESRRRRRGVTLILLLKLFAEIVLEIPVFGLFGGEGSCYRAFIVIVGSFVDAAAHIKIYIF